MQTIFFFYGLAFIILAGVIFLLPRREDCLGLDTTLVFVGWFGLLHGLNEWVELLILTEGPFNAEILSLAANALLPISFTFLIIFGCVTISKIKAKFRWLNIAWILFPLFWAGLSVSMNDAVISGILARYTLCVPGTILTSLAIYLSLRRCDTYTIPRPVVIGAWLSITFFLLYGIFGGIVVPKAAFFPASLINYPNFFRIFLLPIQLFRMVCALIISSGFILFVGVFSKKMYGQIVKGAIKRKLTLIIAVSVAIITITGAILTYFAGSTVLMRILGREYSQIANTLNKYAVSTLRGEIEDAMSYATRPLWKDIVIESSSRYKGMSAESIRLKLIEVDKKWITAKPGDPILKERLDNRVSVGMGDILKARTKISEIFITDRYGGVVASSNKTSDFYQADEEWWQKAYNGGKGSTYVSDIEFDESSKSWVISIAVPMFGPDGEIVGICKDSVGIEKLFGDLTDFRLGNTGHAALVDNKGTVIFHHGVYIMTSDVIPEKILRKILDMKNSYLVMKNSLLHSGETFVAFNEVKPPYLSDRGVSWIVLVVQDMSEVSAPIKSFIIQIAIISVLMMILIIPVGSFFGKIVADPIHELHLATEKVMAGDWDYKIDVRTGDEIEQFAATFKDMIANIKSKQAELQSFSKGLEVKVEERTKELSVAREAALNILEDLQISKETLERTNKELLKLDELKSEFISTVSHELRTPLSIIKEGISLVLDKIPGEINEKQFKILDISKYNIDRLARIIDNLLDISKIEAGKVELRRSLINISEVVKRAASSFEPRISEKGLKMNLDVDDVAGSVWADTDKITQVLTNLIGNAVKFTSSGAIDISCKDKGDQVVCSVSDTGVGISKEDMPKVFSKFQQFGRTSGAGDKGTGLGLSIAKSIVDMHDGVIWVESEPGKGSKFAFKLYKYTMQSLFKEHVSKALRRAEDKAGKMSIIAVNMNPSSGDTSVMANKGFDDIMYESARLMKSALRFEGDDVVNLGTEMIVVLVDCGIEGAAVVQYRLEEVVSKYLADQKVLGAVKVSYGRATYPDDAKSDLELIEKAKAVLAVSAKA